MEFSSSIRRAIGPAPADANVEHCIRVVEREFPYVYRLLRRWGMNHADGEDLAQEVFLVMWRRRQEWDRERSLRPWLAEVAFRLALALRRRRQREVPSEQIDTEDTRFDLEDQVGLAEARGVFLQILSRLSAKQRAVFVLHELDELPIKDVALRLELPLFTVYSRLRSARATFAKELRRLHLTESTRQRRARIGVRVLLIASAVIALAALALAWWPRRTGRAPRPRVAAVRPVLGANAGAPVSSLGRGVVAYWSFDEEAGSALVRDRSGQGHDCRLRRVDASGDRIDGVLGGAVRLPGGGWMECPGAPAFDRLSGAFSISTWVLRSLAQDNLRTIVARQRGDGPDDDFYLGLSPRGVVFSSTGRAQLIAPPVLPTGRWFHLAAIRQPSGEVSVYVNGSQTGQRTSVEQPPAGSSAGKPILIGAAVNGPDPDRPKQQLNGAVDELILYDRDLSARRDRRAGRRRAARSLTTSCSSPGCWRRRSPWSGRTACRSPGPSCPCRA